MRMYRSLSMAAVFRAVSSTLKSLWISVIIYKGDEFVLEFPIPSKFSLTPLPHKTNSHHFLCGEDSGVSWWLLFLLRPIMIPFGL